MGRTEKHRFLFGTNKEIWYEKLDGLNTFIIIIKIIYPRKAL